MTKQLFKFKILSDLRALYTSKPPEVTVVSSGALHVDPQQLLQTAEAQQQIEALKLIAVRTPQPKPE